MAATATVRLTEKTRDALRQLAEARGVTMPAVLEEIVAKARDEALLEQMTVDFARLGADPAARADYQAEASAWDTTLADDLEPRRRDSATYGWPSSTRQSATSRPGAGPWSSCLSIS